MRVLIAFCFFMFLYAKDYKDMSLVELFKNKYYTYICMHRWVYIDKYQKSEDLLSLVAYSCLKKHYLTPALDLSKTLRFTKEGRINGIYINTLYLMKLLLISYINNEKELLKVKLPKIPNETLAEVFYLVKKQKPPVSGDSFEVKDANTTYEVKYSAKENTLTIDLYENGKKLKKEKYW